MRSIFLLVGLLCLAVQSVSAQDTAANLFILTDEISIYTWTPDSSFDEIYSTDGILSEFVRSDDGRRLAFVDTSAALIQIDQGNVHTVSPGNIVILDLETGEITTVVEQFLDGQALIYRQSLVFSPDSQQLAWGEERGVMIYDITSETITPLTSLYYNTGYSTIAYPRMVWSEQGIAYSDGYDSIFVVTLEPYSQRVYQLPEDTTGTLEWVEAWTVYQDTPALLINAVLKRLLNVESGQLIPLIQESGVGSEILAGNYIYEPRGNLYAPDNSIITETTDIDSYASTGDGLLYAAKNEVNTLYYHSNGVLEVIDHNFTEFDLTVIPASGSFVLNEDTYAFAEWAEMEQILAINTCSLPARLSIRTEVMAIDNDVQHIIYAEPTDSAGVIGVVPENETMEIGYGICGDDSLVWYEIIYEGEIGYIAESDPVTGDYWLEPANISGN